MKVKQSEETRLTLFKGSLNFESALAWTTLQADRKVREHWAASARVDRGCGLRGSAPGEAARDGACADSARRSRQGVFEEFQSWRGQGRG